MSKQATQQSAEQGEPRYYVYTGPACNEWQDYKTAEEAAKAHPSELVFDRVTRQPVPGQGV